jgi:hypothetical protein
MLVGNDAQLAIKIMGLEEDLKAIFQERLSVI